MSLGENIAKLRNEHRMSQGDLSEKMDVSRQSISKWETDTSIPDLDKLMILCEVFNVSLDEIVKGNIKEESIPDKQVPVVSKSKQREIGFLLLTLGGISFLLSLFFMLIMTIPSIYLFVCGILCLTIKKNVSLIIGWGTFIIILILMPMFTGLRLGAIFNPQLYQNQMIIQIIILLILWISLIALTIFSLRKTSFYQYKYLIIGWLVLSQIYNFIPIVFGLVPYNGSIYLILSIISTLLLIGLIVCTLKEIIKYKKR